MRPGPGVFSESPCTRRKGSGPVQSFHLIGAGPEESTRPYLVALSYPIAVCFDVRPVQVAYGNGPARITPVTSEILRCVRAPAPRESQAVQGRARLGIGSGADQMDALWASRFDVHPTSWPGRKSLRALCFRAGDLKFAATRCIDEARTACLFRREIRVRSACPPPEPCSPIPARDPQCVWSSGRR